MKMFEGKNLTEHRNTNKLIQALLPSCFRVSWFLLFLLSPHVHGQHVPQHKIQVQIHTDNADPLGSVASQSASKRLLKRLLKSRYSLMLVWCGLVWVL